MKDPTALEFVRRMSAQLAWYGEGLDRKKEHKLVSKFLSERKEWVNEDDSGSKRGTSTLGN